MSKKQRLVIVALVLLMVAGCAWQTLASYFIAGACAALAAMSLVGYQIIKKREQLFSKWLRDALETEIEQPQEPEDENVAQY